MERVKKKIFQKNCALFIDRGEDFEGEKIYCEKGELFGFIYLYFYFLFLFFIHLLPLSFIFYFYFKKRRRKKKKANRKQTPKNFQTYIFAGEGFFPDI